MKYKAGDEVLVKGKIRNINLNDTYPALVEFAEVEKAYFKEDELFSADKTYEQGLADAWELAKKLVRPERQGGLDAICFAKVFGELTDVEDVFLEHTYEDCRDKIEAYEREKFKVGDEVTMLDQYDRPIRGCVVGFYTENLLYVADKDGDIEEWERDKLTKTGVHYDEIESVYERLYDGLER